MKEPQEEIFELLECLKPWFRLGVFPEEGLFAIIGAVE